MARGSEEREQLYRQHGYPEERDPRIDERTRNNSEDFRRRRQKQMSQRPAGVRANYPEDLNRMRQQNAYPEYMANPFHDPVRDPRTARNNLQYTDQAYATPAMQPGYAQRPMQQVDPRFAQVDRAYGIQGMNPNYAYDAPQYYGDEDTDRYRYWLSRYGEDY